MGIRAANYIASNISIYKIPTLIITNKVYFCARLADLMKVPFHKVVLVCYMYVIMIYEIRLHRYYM